MTKLALLFRALQFMLFFAAAYAWGVLGAFAILVASILEGLIMVEERLNNERR